MRTIQLLGLICALTAFVFLFFALAPIEPDSSASAESATGLVLMAIIAPLFGFSALLIVPSSLALISSKLRVNSYFSGKFWYGVLGLNSLLTAGYIIVAIYFGYIYLALSNGN